MSEEEKPTESPEVKPAPEPAESAQSGEVPKAEKSADAPEIAGITFADLALSKEVQKTITKVGYDRPSPIQAEVIPHMLAGRDILGIAQTGTGKTAAFALPILTTLDYKQKNPQVLCLVPTRELALQVAEAFQGYARELNTFKVLPVYGGTSYTPQLKQLQRGAHVIVGTPGRVMDLIRKGKLILSDLKTLVLDEADEMLRMGFIDDVEWVLEHTPDAHQIALFSATMPPPIKKLTKKYLKTPAETTIKVKTRTAETIRQRFLPVRNNNEKIDAMTRILEVEDVDAMLVFVRTRTATTMLAERLHARGHSVEALNGDIAQNQREKIVERLKKGTIDIVVATDIAARGLDVKRISHVVNYDIPTDVESYVHRIGRTGRAGREGDAILLVGAREKRMLQAIESSTRQKITRFEFPSVDDLNERKIQQLFNRIDLELQRDLTDYKTVIQKYMDAKETDPLVLAAAMASMQAESKPFYIKEQERGPRFEGSNDMPDDGVLRDTFRIQVGKNHGLTKELLVDTLTEKSGLEKEHIARVRIYEEHSFVDLPEGMPKQVFKALRRAWVCDRQLEMSKDPVNKKRNQDRRGGGGRRDGNSGSNRRRARMSSGEKGGRGKGGGGRRRD